MLLDLSLSLSLSLCSTCVELSRQICGPRPACPTQMEIFFFSLFLQRFSSFTARCDRVPVGQHKSKHFSFSLSDSFTNWERQLWAIWGQLSQQAIMKPKLENTEHTSREYSTKKTDNALFVLYFVNGFLFVILFRSQTVKPGVYCTVL